MADGNREVYTLAFEGDVDELAAKLAELGVDLRDLKKEVEGQGPAAQDSFGKIEDALQATKAAGEELDRSIERGGRVSALTLQTFAENLARARDQIEGIKATGGVPSREQLAALAEGEASWKRYAQAAADSRERQEKLRREIEFTGKSSRDFARDLGVPLDKLALYGIALQTVKGALKSLEEGNDSAARSLVNLGLAAGDVGDVGIKLQGIFGALNALLRGDIAGAFGSVEKAEARLIEVSKVLLTQNTLGAQQFLAENEARKTKVEALDREAFAIERLIAVEEKHGGVTDETKDRLTKLVALYGKDLPNSVRIYADQLGVLTEQERAARQAQQDAADAYGVGSHALDERLDRLLLLESRLNAAAKAEAAARVGAGESTITWQGQTKSLEDLVDGLQGAKRGWDEGSRSLTLVGEASALQGEGLEKLRGEVKALGVEYLRNGKDIPPALQVIINRLGVLITQQDLASEGAHRWADRFRASVEELDSATEDIVDGFRLVQSEGSLTGEVARDMLGAVIEQLNAYVRIGREAPPELIEVARALGQVVSESERLRQVQADVEDGYRRQVEASRSAIEALDAESGAVDRATSTWDAYAQAVARAAEEASDFEGLPDDGTGDLGLPQDGVGRPGEPGPDHYQRGRDDGEDYGRGYGEGVERGLEDSGGGSSGGPAGGGDGYDAARDAYYRGHGLGELPPLRPIPGFTRNIGNAVVRGMERIPYTGQRAYQETIGGRTALPLYGYGVDTSLSPDGFFQGVLHLVQGSDADSLSEALAAASGEYYEGPAVVSRNTFGGPVTAWFFANATGYLVGGAFYAVDLGRGGETGTATSMGGLFGPGIAPSAPLAGLSPFARPASGARPGGPAGGGSPGGGGDPTRDLLAGLERLGDRFEGLLRGDGGAALRQVGGLG